MKATQIKLDGFEPYNVIEDDNGLTWLYAKYTIDDEPWRTWPKFVQYGSKLFRWSCFNSDYLYVVYKEAIDIDLAIPVQIKTA